MTGYAETVKMQTDIIRIPVWEAVRFLAMLTYNLNVKKTNRINDARNLLNFSWEEKLRKKTGMTKKKAKKFLDSFPDTLPEQIENKWEE